MGRLAALALVLVGCARDVSPGGVVVLARCCASAGDRNCLACEVDRTRHDGGPERGDVE